MVGAVVMWPPRTTFGCFFSAWSSAEMFGGAAVAVVVAATFFEATLVSVLVNDDAIILVIRSNGMILYDMAMTFWLEHCRDTKHA